MVPELLLFVVTVVVAVIWFVRNQRPKNFPPGPQPLPFLGNVLELGDEPHEACWKMSKKYGPIVGIKFGPDFAIVLHGTKLIKEGYGNAVFSGRPMTEAFHFLSGDEKGIVNAVGETWVEQRRFALRNLRDFGFGKSSMEELIMDEVLEFQKWLRKNSGSPVNLIDRFSLAVVNSLWKIVTGDRFDHDDKKLHQILEDLERGGKVVFDFNGARNLFIMLYPQIGKMFPNWSGWNRLVEASKQRVSLFDGIIKDHKSTIQKDVPRDFMDIYLTEIEKTKNTESSFHAETSGVHSLKSVMADFFLAGTDTTAVSLSWLNLYLLHNPRVQDKLHQELDGVIGRIRSAGLPRFRPYRSVTLNDRKSLPYTEAVVLETLRVSSIAGLCVPHAALEDTVFHGYSIPKGTLIFANLYGNHHDPEIWGSDVEEFRPERFLSEDESTVLRHEALVPFSVGRRVCLGETLARDSMFLFAANIALNFKVGGVPGQPLPPLAYKSGQLTLGPVSSTVVMYERTV